MPKKRLSAIVDRATWEIVTKGRAGIWWDSVVEKLWKDIGGNEEEATSAGKVGKYKAEVEERIERREASATKQGGIGQILGDIWGIEGRNRNENVLARANGLRENAKTAFFV